MAIDVLAIDQVAPETLRAAAFHATKGGNGIALPRDLQVRALDIPGPAVQVRRGPSGSAALLSPFTSAGAQSYITIADESEDVEVPATGSAGGATRYIIQYINDPAYPGQATGALPAQFACVNSLTAYTGKIPHIVLARINQPASTATITQDMITDLRQVANPREKTLQFLRPSLSGDQGLVLNSDQPTGEWFPNAGGDWDVEIPDWATRVQGRPEWIGVNEPANKNPYGAKWWEFGPYSAPSQRERSSQKVGFNVPVKGDISRTDWSAPDDVYIPYDYRGTVQKFVMKACYNGADKGIFMDAYSAVAFEIRFLEVADPVL